MKNEYKIIDDYVIIYLKKKKTGEVFKTYIDVEDLPKVLEFKYSWTASWREDVQGYYACATEYLGWDEESGKFKNRIRYLHKFILDSEDTKNLHIDHENHNTLDNRKKNLKPKTQYDNLINRHGANRNTSTGVRNVSYVKKDNMYLVQFQVNGKNTCFGRFKEYEFDKAVELANRLRKEIYGIAN